MERIIEAWNLCFGYTVDEIIRDADFSVHAGEFVAVIGANGAGKSTLIRLLLGELTPSGGRVTLFGQDAAGFRDWKRVGYVPQNGAAAIGGFPATARELVAANLYGLTGPLRFPGKRHRSRVEASLRAVGMWECAGLMAGVLSGGQLQRVLIARALVTEPSLLVLDEPVSGIDTHAADSLYELLAALQKQGIAILMITHDTQRATGYIDRALCLEHGSLVELSRGELLHELHHMHRHPLRTNGKEEPL